jgi:hypothetical protein
MSPILPGNYARLKDMKFLKISDAEYVNLEHVDLVVDRGNQIDLLLSNSTNAVYK